MELTRQERWVNQVVMVRLADVTRSHVSISKQPPQPFGSRLERPRGFVYSGWGNVG